MKGRERERGGGDGAGRKTERVEGGVKKRVSKGRERETEG